MNTTTPAPTVWVVEISEAGSHTEIKVFATREAAFRWMEQDTAERAADMDIPVDAVWEGSCELPHGDFTRWHAEGTQTVSRYDVNA